MSAAHAEGGSEIGRGRPSRQRFTDADEKRLKLLKARAAEASRRLRFKRGEAQRAARVSTLRKLLDVVLEMEPWNEERHVSGREAVWRDCWLRVPGLLKDSDPGNAPRMVQQRIFRMARQLNDPKAGHLWKSCPDVKQRVENVLGKLSTVARFTRKRQGPAEHKNSTLATVETAHASPAQPATVQQHQQQGREKPEKPNLATVEAVHASPAQPATVQQHRQQGREKPERSSLLQLAFHSYVAAAEVASSAGFQ
eukprot:g10050.t1